MELAGKTWFLKVDGKIRGPFDASVVRAMRERGRVNAGTTLSCDRKEWISAQEFKELAFEDEVPIEDVLPTAGRSNALQYFYNDNGVQSGPVTFERLKELAKIGQIKSSDLVWYEGAANWFSARNLDGLEFKTQTKASTDWISNNLVLTSFLAAALLVVLVIPTWYVISFNAASTAKIKKDDKERFDRQTAIDKQNAELMITLQEKENELKEKMRKLEIEEKDVVAKAIDSEIARKRHEEIISEMKKNTKEQANLAAEKARLADAQEQANVINNDAVNAINSQTAAIDRNTNSMPRTCPVCGGDGNSSWFGYARCTNCVNGFVGGNR